MSNNLIETQLQDFPELVELYQTLISSGHTLKPVSDNPDTKTLGVYSDKFPNQLININRENGVTTITKQTI